MSLISLKRNFHLPLEQNNAFFLWGPRKVGKTTFLRQHFPNAKYYDLLDTRLKTALLLDPAKIREEILALQPTLVIIDEVQKVPALLDEVHWCLENTKTKFILCGSSARKLRHGAANLLGGRAWRFALFPLTTNEVKKPDLLRIVNHGLIPKHYLEAKPERSLKGYVLDYIEEEIRSEALTRNIPAFARFLDAVALTHGQLLNYANVARDCGIDAKTVREYYQILEDTLLGHRLPPWRKTKKRRLIETEKFYLFDVGVVRALSGMRSIQEGTEEFGRFFEHFLIEEIRAYLSYREKDLPLSFWRTSTQLEVDLIIGQLDVAIEFKASAKTNARSTKGLQALMEDQKVRQSMIVCLEKQSRQLANGILVLPWTKFCERLWNDDIV